MLDVDEPTHPTEVLRVLATMFAQATGADVVRWIARSMVVASSSVVQ